MATVGAILATLRKTTNAPTADDPNIATAAIVYGPPLFRAPLRAGGATAHVLATGEVVVVQDTAVADRFGPYPQLARPGVRSFAIVPLTASGAVLGAASARSRFAVTDRHQKISSCEGLFLRLPGTEVSPPARGRAGAKVPP